MNHCLLVTNIPKLQFCGLDPSCVQRDPTRKCSGQRPKSNKREADAYRNEIRSPFVAVRLDCRGSDEGTRGSPKASEASTTRMPVRQYRHRSNEPCLPIHLHFCSTHRRKSALSGLAFARAAVTTAS